MEEGGRDQQPVLGRVVDPAEIPGVVDDVTVRQHHAFGVPRGPRRVEQVGQGLGGQVDDLETIGSVGDDRIEREVLDSDATIEAPRQVRCSEHAPET